MAFESYTTAKLHWYKKVLLACSIVALVLMCFALGYGLYQSTKHDDTLLIFLVPTVFAPLAILPSLFSAVIDKEIKRRQKGS
jgi:hypothetical protein